MSMTYKIKNPTPGAVFGVLLGVLIVLFGVFCFSAWLLMLGLGGLASGGLGKAVGFWQAFPMAVFLTLVLGGGRASSSK